MRPHNGRRLVLSSLFERLRPILEARDAPVYLVGGAVRDALLGRAGYDLDYVVPRGAIDLAYAVADELKVAAYALDHERDIGRVVFPDGVMLDFARFRGEDLEADLRARDFTINAMAIPVAAPRQEMLIDPCSGRDDLRAGLIRLTHEAAIVDDPVRAVRAVRLADQLSFKLVEETAAAVRGAAQGLGRESPERVRDEFLKLLCGHAPHRALLQMSELALLPVVLPELAALESVAHSSPHHESVLAHTLSVLQWLVEVERCLTPDAGPNLDLEPVVELLQPYAVELRAHLARRIDGGLDGRTLLRLGALFHDVGKAKTQQVGPEGRIRFTGHDKVGPDVAARRLRRLRLSNEAVDHVQAIVAGHMRPLRLSQTETVTRRAVYRFFRATGGAGLDIALLSLADHLATYGGWGPPQPWSRMLTVVDSLLTNYVERYEETIAPPPLLTGGELIEALDLAPGPEIGRLLRRIEEAQAAGEIAGREEALALARRLHTP